jgi:type VI secretion system secreted protein VgrG
MAQLVTTSISINDTEIKQFSQFQLNQSVAEHHTFRLVCPQEAIEGPNGSYLQVSQKYIGKTIQVKISPVHAVADAPLEFFGVITQVEAARTNGHVGDVILTGFSPTVLLDSAPHCKSWEKKAIKNIVTDVLGHFPQKLINAAIKPASSETLSYTVQYRETAWQFLNRLHAIHNEWFFYDGRKLIAGNHESKEVKLIFGANLSRFNVTLQIRPPQFQMNAYDYSNNEVYTGTPKDVASLAGFNEQGKQVLACSNEFYANQPNSWHSHYVTNQKQLDDYINKRAAAQGSNMVRFNGVSSNTAIRLGDVISITGRDVVRDAEDSFDTYSIIGVNHFCDGQGHYHNDFISIPSTIRVSPVNGYVDPHCETQSAYVTDNFDPRGFGRIRVRFHWMKPSQKTPWIRITSMHGGSEKGMYFVPEIGEEVMVGFEGGRAEKPFVLGTVYHARAKTSFGNEGNDMKVLQTRSGTRIIYNDAEGSITIFDPSENTIHMDGKGNITMSSKETINLNSKIINITASQDVNVTAKNNIAAGAKNNVGISADQALTANGKTISITGVDSISANTKELAANGKTSTTINGGKIEVSAPGDVKVSGAIVKINS